MTWVPASVLRRFFSEIKLDKLKCLTENNVVKAIHTRVSDKFNVIESFKLHYWPSFMCMWFFITLIMTYGISVGKKHAYQFFPYISDTGTYPPESCIFGQMINMGTLMMVLNMYLRYRQVEIVTQSYEIDCSKWNRTSMWLAMIGCFGMSIVANFQKMNMRGIHFLGADMVLGGTVLYTILQAKISYALRDLARKDDSYGITHRNILLRVVISGTCVVLFFLLVGCGYASEKDLIGDLIWWTPNDNGYVPHVIATISEWLIIILMSVFIMSFTNEFKVLEFNGIQFNMKS